MSKHATAADLAEMRKFRRASLARVREISRELAVYFQVPEPVPSMPHKICPICLTIVGKADE